MSLGIEDFLQCNFVNLFCFILVGEMAMEFIILQMKVEAPVKNGENLQFTNPIIFSPFSSNWKLV